MRELLRRESFRPRGGICSGGVRQDISCPNRIPNMILTIFKLFMFLSLLPICIINIDFLELDSYRLSQLRMKHAEFCIKYQSSQFLRVFFYRKHIEIVYEMFVLLFFLFPIFLGKQYLNLLITFSFTF